jgi:hypothetical protein
MTKYFVQDECGIREVHYNEKRVLFPWPSGRGETEIIDTGNGIDIHSTMQETVHLDYCAVADLIIAFHILQDQGQELWHGNVFRGRQIVDVPIARRKK